MADGQTAKWHRFAVVAMILFLPGILVIWLVKYANAPAGRLADASITVRRFQDAGGSAALAAPFTDGVAKALARIPGLRVTPAGAIVLDGTLQQSGGRLTVAAKLGDANNGAEIWSRRYERTAGDAAAITEEMSRDVLNALRARAIGQRR